ncbi:TIGR01212 family radical SAM protein [uncultured Bacteroides sp.]|uniref:TIGR01212 family radical SAM protein n=1 Tax=uncultured Bacteroides sp. TaxID=162156 RepID=UPI0025F74C3A|nr:TIGR01212 family radical SAM protein [uncultured Bacteroides sp.]
MDTTAHQLYKDFPTFLRKTFSYKVQKISLNAGFTCPNRDGTRGWGGCTYCNNQTFNPEYCRTEKSITTQLEEGKRFFAHKYPEMKFLAYFQAYTNTYAELEGLKRKYEEALEVDNVVGLVIGTRPDCMPEDLLRYLEELNRRTFLMVEYGIESTCNETLKRINRGHTYEDTVEAVRRTAACGIPTGGHIILGLPGETHDSMVSQAGILSDLPLSTLKIHQLQLIRGTRMAHQYDENPADFHLFTEVDEYIDLVIDYVEHLRPELVLERFVSQSPKDLLIAPDWGLKNYEFVARLQKRMQERGAYQGKKYKDSEKRIIFAEDKFTAE